MATGAGPHRGPGPRRKRGREGRRRAWRKGQWAETYSAWYLRFLGYRILDRGWRCSAGEIDIIARRGKALAMVEVKQRASITQAWDAVTPHQRRRISRAAGAYLAHRPALVNLFVRFDVMAVRPWRIPLHIKDAWRESGPGHGEIL